MRKVFIFLFNLIHVFNLVKRRIYEDFIFFQNVFSVIWVGMIYLWSR